METDFIKNVILVVDDEPAIVGMMKRTLELIVSNNPSANGILYEVWTCSNLEEALAIYKKGRVAGIITDVHFPERPDDQVKMNPCGFKLVDIVVQDILSGKKQAIPLIISSAMPGAWKEHVDQCQDPAVLGELNKVQEWQKSGVHVQAYVDWLRENFQVIYQSSSARSKPSPSGTRRPSASSPTVPPQSFVAG